MFHPILDLKSHLRDRFYYESSCYLRVLQMVVLSANHSDLDDLDDAFYLVRHKYKDFRWTAYPVEDASCFIYVFFLQCKKRQEPDRKLIKELHTEIHCTIYSNSSSLKILQLRSEAFYQLNLSDAKFLYHGDYPVMEAIQGEMGRPNGRIAPQLYHHLDVAHAIADQHLYQSLLHHPSLYCQDSLFIALIQLLLTFPDYPTSGAVL